MSDILVNNETHQLTETQLKLLDRVIDVLKGMKLDYAVRMPDGTINGDLDAVRGKKPKAPTERKRAPLTYKYGELRAYIRPYLDGMTPGNVVVVPCGQYKLDVLRSSVSSYMSAKYGNKMHTIVTHHDKGCIEVMHTGGL